MKVVYRALTAVDSDGFPQLGWMLRGDPGLGSDFKTAWALTQSSFTIQKLYEIRRLIDVMTQVSILTTATRALTKYNLVHTLLAAQGIGARELRDAAGSVPEMRHNLHSTNKLIYAAQPGAPAKQKIVCSPLHINCRCIDTWRGRWRWAIPTSR